MHQDASRHLACLLKRLSSALCGVLRRSTHAAVTRTHLSDQWQAIEGACSPLYTPAAADKGLRLRVQCVPAR